VERLCTEHVINSVRVDTVPVIAHHFVLVLAHTRHRTLSTLAAGLAYGAVIVQLSLLLGYHVVLWTHVHGRVLLSKTKAKLRLVLSHLSHLMRLHLLTKVANE